MGFDVRPGDNRYVHRGCLQEPQKIKFIGECMKPTILLTISAVLIFEISAHAHHSIVGTYDYNKHVTLDAKIVQVSLRNPHSFIQVEAADANGVVQRWSLEWGSAAQLVNQGVDRNSLK